MAEKAEVVERFTGCAHLRSLTDSQANRLYNQLHNQLKSADKMRKKLIWLAFQMGFDRPKNSIEQATNSYRLCIDNLNKWLEQKSPSLKKMNDQNPDQLNDSVSQLEVIYKKTLKKLNDGNKIKADQKETCRNHTDIPKAHEYGA